MNTKKEQESNIYLIDTSAVLSGKPLQLSNKECWTTEEIADEFSPGGRSWRNFLYLKEFGLTLHRPSQEARKKIQRVLNKLGETHRLSPADQSLLALAMDIQLTHGKKPILLTDDYSIQNVAHLLQISFQPLSQRGITKTFKWIRRCRGCKRTLSSNETICPICGSSGKDVVVKKTK